MLDIKNKKVTVVGAQRSGLAALKFVRERGGIPRLTEIKSEKDVSGEIKKEVQTWCSDVEWGRHTPELIQSSDFIVLSPGVRFDSAPVEWAKEKLIPVLGEIEFAFQFCDKPVIAVTGSNGKTTVSTLIKESIAAAGYRVALCGNIGSPFCAHISRLSHIDYVVLEVSSFQMESLYTDSGAMSAVLGGTIKGFKPYVAVLLNFSQNHLDRHKDIDEYFEAKGKIFLNQDETDFAVLNAGNERIKTLASALKAQVRFLSQDSDAEGKDNPNHLAVKTVADILGLDRVKVDAVLSEFKGVEHRLEQTAVIDGVYYINDSKSTTAESGRWALTALDSPVLMICGGRDKNIDFRVLTSLVQQKVKKMFVLGEAAEKLQTAFQDVVDVTQCASLEEAVVCAKQAAEPGDAIVLSPMCASFDMFDNFEHRGRVFKKIVQALTKD